MEELMNYSNILNLRHFLRQAGALQPQCHKDLSEVQKSIEDYEKKIHTWKQKAAAAESGT